MERIIGYTTGVFDLFHIGHLNILKRARSLCDYLIVGVSTDELCLSYKHKAPIVPFEERLAIVESIRYVDKVIPQTDRDKYEAWERLHFNRLFVGDDWKGTPFFNDLERRFAEVGVEIVFFPYTHSVSSSVLRQKLTDD